MNDKTKILEMAPKDIPETVTVCCPLKGFKNRYLHKGCLNCDYFGGVRLLCDAEEISIKNPVSGEVTGTRPLGWHEKYMIVCACPTTRRCSNIEIIEEE